MRKLSRVFATLVVLFVVTPLPAQTSPEWDALMQGNRAFQGGYLNRDLARRLPIADGQAPPVAVLSCSDSRVPPEVVFNRPIAQMFVVRTAGNVTETYATASLEYAVAVLSTKMIVVMGHESCGAIHSALTPEDDGKLTPFLKKLVLEIRKSFGDIPEDQWDAGNRTIVRRATLDHARRVARQLLADSALLREREGETLTIVSAYYNLETGVVELVPVP
jgi:carbonic anhydrase